MANSVSNPTSSSNHAITTNKNKQFIKHDVQNMLPMKDDARTMTASYLAAPPDIGSIEAAAVTASKNRSRRRNRTKFSETQLEILEATFDRNHYPDVNSVDKLANLLGLTTERISVWFQNRRARYKRMRKNGATHAPELKPSSSKFDINEIANKFSHQIAELANGDSKGDDDDDYEENSAYDENSNGKYDLSSNKAEAKSNLDPKYEESSVINEQNFDLTTRTRTLADIKNDLLNADEETQSAFAYNRLPVSSYPNSYLEGNENSNSSAGPNNDASLSNYFYYNSQLACYPKTEPVYYNQSYLPPISHFSTVPSADSQAQYNDNQAVNSNNSNINTNPYAYQYPAYDQYYQNYAMPGYFNYSQHASYFYQQNNPYHQIPTVPTLFEPNVSDYQKPNDATSSYHATSQHIQCYNLPNADGSTLLPSPAPSVESSKQSSDEASENAGSPESYSEAGSPAEDEGSRDDPDA